MKARSLRLKGICLNCSRKEECAKEFIIHNPFEAEYPPHTDEVEANVRIEVIKCKRQEVR